MNKYFDKSVLFLAFAVFVCGLTPALAADQDSTKQNAQSQTTNQAANANAVEMVTVTAERRAQLAQKVPASVDVLPADVLEKIGFTNFADLSQTVPALSITPFSYGSSLLEVFMRGVGQVDVINISRDPGVGVYLDDVYLARSTGLTTDLGDTTRVEVLPGPQGTLYGRNTIGGAVKFITEAPTGVFDAKEQLDIGNFGYIRSLTTVDLPEYDGFSIRLTYLGSNLDGWVRNPGTGGNFDIKDQQGFRGAIRWQPNDRFTVDYTFDYGMQDGSPPYFQHGYDYPPFDYPGISLHGPIQPNFVDVSYRPGNFPERDDFTQSGNALTATWNISDTTTLKSISSYRWINSLFEDDTFEAFNLPVAEYYKTEQNQFSQEFLLNGSAADQAIKYDVGAFYFTESAQQTYGYNYNIFITHYPTLGDLNYSPAKAQNSAEAVYANVSWTPPILGDRFDIIAGGRFSWDQRDAQGGLVFFSRGTTSSESFDPSVTLDYRWTDNIMSYVKMAEAYRAGGFNVYNSILKAFNPERLVSYEAGWKSTWWDDRALFNIDVFTQDYKDIQVGTIGVVDGILVTETENLAKARYQGFEGDFELIPVEGLKLDAQAAYLEPKILEVGAAAFFPPVLSNAPKWKYDLSAEYTFDPFTFGTLSLLARYTYDGSQYSGGSGLTPGYGLVNARATLSEINLGLGDTSLALWGNNLTDKHYIYFNSGGGIIFGEPLSYGMTLIFRY